MEIANTNKKYSIVIPTRGSCDAYKIFKKCAKV
jgi:hypothetical protein